VRAKVPPFSGRWKQGQLGLIGLQPAGEGQRMAVKEGEVGAADQRGNHRGHFLAWTGALDGLIRPQERAAAGGAFPEEIGIEARGRDHGEPSGLKAAGGKKPGEPQSGAQRKPQRLKRRVKRGLAVAFRRGSSFGGMNFFPPGAFRCMKVRSTISLQKSAKAGPVRD
jgi:hypothetical protein